MLQFFHFFHFVADFSVLLLGLTIPSNVLQFLHFSADSLLFVTFWGQQSAARLPPATPALPVGGKRHLDQFGIKQYLIQ